MADEGRAIRPVRANRPVRTIEIALFDLGRILELIAVDILCFPSVTHSCGL